MKMEKILSGKSDFRGRNGYAKLHKVDIWWFPQSIEPLTPIQIEFWGSS